MKIKMTFLTAMLTTILIASATADIDAASVPADFDVASVPADIDVVSVPVTDTANKTKKSSIRFDGNGATSGSMDSITGCRYKKEYRLPANSFKRKGYKFSGWNTKKDGSGRKYANKAGYIRKSGTKKTVTLYARWKKVYNSGYGVYLGVDDYSKLEKLTKGNDIVVIEGQSFSAKQIKALKKKGKTVYSYLDVGSLETYRPYYRKFKHLALDPYENWPDEYWIDVSDRSWQEYISGTVAGKLKKKGIDGFFIDNCDVYSVYNERNGMYKGLVAIMKNLKNLDADVVINGGDVFVKRLIKEEKATLIDGVNQECVFSRIEDYENDVFAPQTSEDTEYFTKYLAKAKKNKLKVFLLEYTTDTAVKKRVHRYCTKNGFGYFISGKVNLDGSVRY